jgi:hypothetical protein
MSFQPPEGLSIEDEYRHPLHNAPSNVLFGDSLWVSVVDPEAGIHGVNHFHLTNKGTIKLWMRAVNDLENRHDCYEAFCNFEVEETREQGTGTAEYSLYPPYPQWLV